MYSADVNHNGPATAAPQNQPQQPYGVPVNPQGQRGPGAEISQAAVEARIPQPVAHAYHQMPNPVSTFATQPANTSENVYPAPTETMYHPGHTYYVAAPVTGQPIAYAMPNTHPAAGYAITQSPAQANTHFKLIQYHPELPQQTMYQPQLVTQPSSAAVGPPVFQPGQSNMYQIPAFINPNLNGIGFVPETHSAVGHVNQGNTADYGAALSSVEPPHYQQGPQNTVPSNPTSGSIFQQGSIQKPQIGQQMAVMAIPTAGLVNNSAQNMLTQAPTQPPYSVATTESVPSGRPFQVT
jgi:hypothetical protein